MFPLMRPNSISESLISEESTAGTTSGTRVEDRNSHPSIKNSTRICWWWNKKSQMQKRRCVLFVVAAVIAIILVSVLVAILSFKRVGDEILRHQELYMTTAPTITPVTKKETDRVSTPNLTTTVSTEEPDRFTAHISTTKGTKTEVCTTEKCVLSASNLLQSMNPGIDPCDDFYEFACGNWKKNHLIPDYAIMYSWIHEKTREIQNNVRDFLRQTPNSDDPRIWTTARNLYASCMDTDTLNSLGMEPVTELVKKIGLEELPPLLFNSSLNDDADDFNWMAVAAKAKKYLSIDLILGLSIEPYFKPEANVIILSPGSKSYSFLLGFRNYTQGAEDISGSTREETQQEANGYNELLKWWIYYVEILREIYDIPVNDSLLIMEDLNVLKNEFIEGYENVTIPKSFVDKLKKLPQMINATQNLTMIEEEIYAHISIDTLQKLTDEWTNGTIRANWTEYFSILFEDVDDVINGSTMILVLEPAYIKNAILTMSRTPTSLAKFLMWWEVVEPLVGHTNSELRNLKDWYIKSVYGNEVTEARSITCTNVVMNNLGLAVLSFFASSEFLNTTMETLEEMYANVKHAFTSIVKSSTWLNNEEKEAIVNEVEEIFIYPAYPNWLVDKDKLDEYYEGLETDRGQFLLSAVNISRWHMEKKLASLATGNHKHEKYEYPASINAYYSNFHHSITVLAGFLQFPFYDLGHDALNYGMTAFALGHELSHAFDPSGIMYRNGELGLWWRMAFLQKYQEKADCFVNRYSHYGWNMKLEVNGKRTLHENMADNGGLLTSLVAYQNILKKKESELKLPGLGNYTSEQLFFLSFANFFCSVSTIEGKEFSLSDVHAPQKFRLIGSVSNSEEFSRIWDCPKGKNMNTHEEKCKIW